MNIDRFCQICCYVLMAVSAGGVFVSALFGWHLNALLFAGLVVCNRVLAEIFGRLDAMQRK